MSEKTKMEKEMELVTVEFQVGKFAIAFLKAYKEFMGSKSTIEGMLRQFVYDGVLQLRDQVRELPYAKDGFFDKYSFLCILDSPEQRKEREEIERQSDC